MTASENSQEGIEWSAPVLVRKDGDGKLVVEVPDQVVARLELEERDVVCYTGFFDGAIEFWSVKKSPYTSLEDEGVAERLAGEGSS